MARGETAKSGTQVRVARYESGSQVWVGQSRGAMREGTVMRYLGEGSYSVFIPGCGAKTVDEGLLSHQDGGAEGRALQGLPAKAGWRVTGTEERSLVEQRRIRWYNPKLENFEWREVPRSDEEALSLLEGSPYTPTCTETYRQWRGLGSSITVALIRAGEAAKEGPDQGAPS
jgi:hypothetical protein